MKKITLPWPPSKTSSNGSQGDFRGKASAAKGYKATCAKECIAQNVRPFKSVKHGERLPVKITYHPPTEGRVDWDNISNRAKQGFDAVSDAIGIDDGRWWPVTLDRGEKVKGGCIVIEAGAVSIPFIGTINANERKA
jgi:crossover junction endodeoxyribonuclease RusA